MMCPDPAFEETVNLLTEVGVGVFVVGFVVAYVAWSVGAFRRWLEEGFEEVRADAARSRAADTIPPLNLRPPPNAGPYRSPAERKSEPELQVPAEAAERLRRDLLDEAEVEIRSWSQKNRGVDVVRVYHCGRKSASWKR